MKYVLLACLLMAGAAPAHAQAEAAIAAAQLVEQKAYDAWTHIQIVQELLVLTQTYNASVAYYDQWKQLNSGHTLLYTIDQQVKAGQNQETQRISQEFMSAVNARGVAPQKLLFQTIDQTVAANIQYTGTEMANVTANRQIGVNIAANADSLAPKDAANLAARTAGLEIQMLTQLHEDNLRLIQLISLQLTGQARPTESQENQTDNIKASIQSRYPTATLDTEGGQ